MGKNFKDITLTLGYALGPFCLVSLLSVFLAMLGWPKNSIFNWLTLCIPVCVGAVCFGISLKRLDLSRVWLIPYVVLYFFAVGFFAIIPALMLGAPK